ncbi:MAG TPA: thioredoxin-like domain-containing protein [Hymenobacter sp.]|uniref:TlpA family protein disulfide reductase n=1 Tax=Hymenobacter sp. TaxID=1898978 RepID=UPI002D7F7D2B|nr:thioredoxin-like domain-containing protein [Hymenobacter sp.]HET9503839.1 thioredoxin-like domain-containing protein [Hymenobacter sp.]
MSYLKTLWWLVVVVLARAAQAQSPGGAELRGHVDNDIGSTINISWLAQPFDTREHVARAHTNAQGDFQIRLPISGPTLLQLSYEGEEAPLFLEPGQAVAIRFNADNVAASRHFTPLPGSPDKHAANANNYLREAETKYTDNEAYQVLPDNINLLEKAFLSFLDYRRSHELNLFRQADRRGALTPAFVAFAQGEINYAYANDRLTYVDLREQTAGDLQRLTLSAGYYDFLADNTLVPGNESVVSSPHYEEFLLNYVHHQVRSQGRQPTDPDYYPACYQLADQLLKGPVRPVVLGRVLLETFRLGHVAHAQALLAEYEATGRAPRRWAEQLRAAQVASATLAIGSPAPPLPLRTTTGDSLSLATYRGKLVYLMFWDSRFPASQHEQPYLKELVQVLSGQPIVVVSVALDEQLGNWNKTVVQATPPPPGVQAYVPAAQQAAVRQAYGINKLPAAVLLAEDGTILDPHPKRVSSRALQDDLKRAIGRAAAYRAVVVTRL